MDPSANTTAAAATTTTTAITTTTATVLFGGEVTSVRVLLNLLKAIQIKNIVTVNIYDEGITFTAEETRSAKAVAYLKRHLFQSYRKQMSAGEIEPFGVGLSTLVDCLSMLSLGGGSVTADTCRIRYAGEGAPLELIREDKEMDASTQCRLVTLDPDPESMELSISDGPTLIDRAIMKSSWLKDALSDLDRTCERVTLTFSPEDPCFVLQGDGANGSFQMEYPENSQSFVSFQCDHEVSFSYHYSHIMLCTKALDQSDEVSMRVSQDGVLGMLFRIQTLNQESYVEFTIIPFESSSAS